MTDRAKVLLLPFYYLPERWNGMDEHMLLLARYLDPTRYELCVLRRESDGPQTTILAQRAGIACLSAPFDEAASLPARCLGLARLLRRERISLVHIHSPAAGGQLWAALAARLAGAAVVATFHQVQAWRMPRRTRGLNRLMQRLSARTLAVSQDVSATLASAAGFEEQGIEVVYNAVEPAADGLAPLLGARTASEVRLGYFGRLSPEKGLALLLRAFALARAETPALGLYLAGEGPQRPQLESLAATLGIGDHVTFLGFREDARLLMQEMDVVVHVPEYEGFGLVLLEAMAAGRPLLVNDAPGGMTELVRDGLNGRVVPAGSVEALERAMRELAADPEARERLGANGRRLFAGRWAPPLLAERVASVYESALAKRNRAPSGQELTSPPDGMV